MCDYEVVKIVQISADTACASAWRSLRYASVPTAALRIRPATENMHTLRRYIRRGKLYRDNASAKIGL